MVSHFHFFILKGHYHERSIKPFSVSSQQVNQLNMSNKSICVSVETFKNIRYRSKFCYHVPVDPTYSPRMSLYSCSQLHKITNAHVVLYGAWLLWFWCGAKTLLGPLEGLGNASLDFFEPKQLSLCSSCFRAQKSLDFHGPTHPMARIMPLPRIKIITARAIQSTGSLIVIMLLSSWCPIKI